MRKTETYSKLLVAIVGLTTLTGCFLQESVKSGLGDGIASGLATVLEEFIVSSAPTGGTE